MSERTVVISERLAWQLVIMLDYLLRAWDNKDFEKGTPKYKKKTIIIDKDGEWDYVFPKYIKELETAIEKGEINET